MMSASRSASRVPSVAVAVLIALATGRADAGPDGSLVELGGGIDFTVLDSFDVGESLGGPTERNDLGPGTLGVFVAADLRVVPALRVGGEAGIAIGGLVRTDERYFGGRNDVGSTLTAWLRSKVGWTALPVPGMSVRVGGALGVERMAEATGAGSVHLDSIVAGPWASLVVGSGLVAEVHADLHAPYHGRIGDDTGNPDGLFFGAGIRLAYMFGLGLP
jgi:hypothetical protein